MDFETKDNVTIDEYFRMIRLKTAVLLACSLKTGAIIGIAVLVNLWRYGDLLEIIRYCAIASMFFGIFFGVFKTKLPGSNTNIQH